MGEGKGAVSGRVRGKKVQERGAGMRRASGPEPKEGRSKFAGGGGAISLYKKEKRDSEREQTQSRKRDKKENQEHCWGEPPGEKPPRRRKLEETSHIRKGLAPCNRDGERYAERTNLKDRNWARGGKCH